MDYSISHTNPAIWGALQQAQHPGKGRERLSGIARVLLKTGGRMAGSVLRANAQRNSHNFDAVFRN